MSRTFIREIPIERFTDKDFQYYSNGEFEIVWKEESVEIYSA
jgi:hypothetical protein